MCLTLLHDILLDDMQRVDGAKAQNICKYEFQALMEFFVSPLVELRVQQRLDLDNAATVTPLYTVHKLSDNGVTAIPVQQTLQQICDYWRSQLNGAFVGLRAKLWSGQSKVPRTAYEPSCRKCAGAGHPPYFVTLDNAGAHSFWLVAKPKSKRKHMPRMGVSLLQLVTMPPQGHDAHQVIEHAIGAIKGHVNRRLRELKREGTKPTQAMLHDAVRAGMLLFNAGSLARNIKRLRNCMRVVAAKERMKISFTREVWSEKEGGQWIEKEMWAYGTFGKFPPETIA